MVVELRRNPTNELNRRKTDLSAEVLEIRRSVEGGRATVPLPDGRVIPVWADTVSQSKLTGAALGATLDSGFQMNWKGADGAFYTLTAAAVIALANGVRAHIQAAFDREATLNAEISAAQDLTELLAINIKDGWPGTIGAGNGA